MQKLTLRLCCWCAVELELSALLQRLGEGCRGCRGALGSALAVGNFGADGPRRRLALHAARLASLASQHCASVGRALFRAKVAVHAEEEEGRMWWRDRVKENVFVLWFLVESLL